VQALEVSARRQLERDHAATLTAERERLQALLASSAAIIHSARLPGFEIDYISESMTTVLGFSLEQARAPGFWADAIHPDDRDRMLAQRQAMLATGHVVSEYRHRHADGSWRWLRADVRVVRDGEGQPLRAVGASLDITSRHRDEVRLATLLAVQQIVSRVSAAFLALQGDDLALAVRECLARLGEVARAQRVFVARVSGRDIGRAVTWRARGHEQPTVVDDNVAIAADVAVNRVRLERGEAHVASSSTTAAGALFLVPFVAEDELRGVLAVDAPGLDELQPDELLALVQRVAEALASGQRRAESELELRALTSRLERRAEQQRALLQLSGQLARASTRRQLYTCVRHWLRSVADVDHLAFVKRVEPARVRVRVFAGSGDHDAPFSSDVTVETTPDCAFETAVRTGVPVSTADHAIDAFADWQALAAAGLRQAAVIPLVGASDVLGALVVGTRRDDPWTVEDQSWAAQLGVLFAGHLSTLRAGDALRRMNEELERRVDQRTAELRASEERFELLFQSAPQAMVLADRAGRVVQSNRGAQAMFGYDDADFTGLPLSALLPAPLRGRHDDHVRAFHDEGHTRARAMALGRTVRGLRRDGSEFPAEIGLVPLVVRGEQQVVAGITDVSARVAAQEAVSRSLREKEVLLKEIHHRVKNNLQIISSLLMLQSDQLSSADTRRILHESVYRVRSMALIHQLFYGGQSLERVDFGAYARGLATSLAGVLAPTAKVEVVADDVAVSVETAVPLGLVLNELLTNAFKYGLPPDTGTARAIGAAADVVVTVHVDGDDLLLAVRDSGPGLPADVDIAGASTLGLQLVRSLVRQLRGRVTAQRTPRAQVTLRCPLAAQ
jgi:PAS domain S-box-containing protein